MLFYQLCWWCLSTLSYLEEDIERTEYSSTHSYILTKESSFLFALNFTESQKELVFFWFWNTFWKENNKTLFLYLTWGFEMSFWETTKNCQGVSRVETELALMTFFSWPAIIYKMVGLLSYLFGGWCNRKLGLNLQSLILSQNNFNERWDSPTFHNSDISRCLLLGNISYIFLNCLKCYFEWGQFHKAQLMPQVS